MLLKEINAFFLLSLSLPAMCVFSLVGAQRLGGFGLEDVKAEISFFHMFAANTQDETLARF